MGVTAGLLGLLLTTWGAALPATPGAATPAAAAPSSTPLVFHVRNVNRTPLPCAGDGRDYTLRGELVTPAASTGAVGTRVNVLVHDFTTGGWFWHLRADPAYDYATQLARRGETSLVLDRLGYDRSPLPDGRRTCLGAQADMLHQVVTSLRDAGADSVVLHGHSVGAALAELEAATFVDVDGLVLMSWSDLGASPRAVIEAARQSSACAFGAGYAPYGRTDRDFRELLFVTAPRDVQLAAVARRNLDPCGDALSLAPLVVTDNLLTRSITQPVLLLFGEKDALNRPDAADLQRRAYAPSARVSTYVVPGAGSALPLESSAAATRERVLGWLGSLG